MSWVANFFRPEYDLSFQIEMAKAVRAEKVPAGTLLWIGLPFKANTIYEPCFGVYVDPALTLQEAFLLVSTVQYSKSVHYHPLE